MVDVVYETAKRPTTISLVILVAFGKYVNVW